MTSAEYLYDARIAFSSSERERGQALCETLLKEFPDSPEAKDAAQLLRLSKETKKHANYGLCEHCGKALKRSGFIEGAYCPDCRPGIIGQRFLRGVVPGGLGALVGAAVAFYFDPGSFRETPVWESLGGFFFAWAVFSLFWSAATTGRGVGGGGGGFFDGGGNGGGGE